MVALSYSAALKATLVHEGGWSDRPDDPGGATMKGVTQAVYDGFRRRKGLKLRSVRLIETAELQEIYRRQYWDAIRGDELPRGLDYAVFDGAVNSGPSRSAKWLQAALGTVKVDGEIGEATLAALEAHPDHDALIAAICARRMTFLKSLKTWKSFGKGWSRRVAGVEALGQAWATGGIGPQAVFHEGGNAKGTIEQARPAPSPAGGDVAIGGGLATASAGGVLQQAREALAPLAGSSGWIDSAIAALALTGAAITIGGILWRLYARRKAAQQGEALGLEVPA